MGLFSWLIKKKTEVVATPKPVIENKECKDLLSLKRFMDKLLSENRYIAKSEYKDTILNAQKTVEHFVILEKSQVLNSFCKNNGIDASVVREVIDNYHNWDSIMESHNDKYIAMAIKDEKSYLDKILYDVDPKILLDEDQRKVVLTDEDYCLVIAGAGAGKTTTVAAKVKYLVEKKGIDPKQILVVSFTNKAVQELRDKLNTDLNIPCPVATFHSTGNAIIRKQSDEPLNIVDDSKLYFVIQDYFKNSILKNEALVNNLILFFA